MGHIARVDLDSLRRIADQALTIGDEVADMHWPLLDPDALRGAVVDAATVAEPARERMREVAAGLRAWAASAHATADAFERVDAASADRLAPG